MSMLLLLAACDGSTEPGGGENPLPSVYSVSPATMTVGDEPPLVTVTGSRFVSASRGRINGGDRQTTFESASTLRVQLLPTDLAAVATLSLTVVSPEPGGGTSGRALLDVGFPPPVLTSLVPAEIQLGDAAPLLVFNGTGFVPESEVLVGGSSLPSTFISATELHAQVPSSVVRNAGIHTLKIRNPAPGGDSNEKTFSVKNPVPTLTSVAPDSLFRGSGPLTMTLEGENFVDGSLVQLDGAWIVTNLMDTGVLLASVPKSALTNVRTAEFRVMNPAPGGGLTLPISVDIVPPPPTITLLSPDAVNAGSAGFTLTVSGTDFEPDAVVEVNGAPRAATFVNEARLTLEIAADEVSSAGTLMIVVRNVARGTTSPMVGLPILSPSPEIGVPVIVELQNNHAVADPVRSVVYVSVPSSVPDIGNTVTRIDPLSGDILGSVAVGSEPGRMAISDDGQFLYVALNGAPLITRVRLADFQADLEIPLPPGGFLGERRVEDLEVLPGSPTLLAASLRNMCCSPRHEGVFLFSGATVLPSATQGHTGSNRITVSGTANELFGLNNETSEFGFRRIRVAADGLHEETVVRAPTGFGTDIEFSGGRVYGTNGGVLSTSTLSSVGTIAASGVVRPDAARGRVHFLAGGELRTFHFTSLLLIGSAPVPDALGLNTVVRWGTDGLLFGGGSRLVIVRGSLIGP